MPQSSTQRFYDELAERYHLVYPDWEASIARQGQALRDIIERTLGPGPRTVLDCACGIGTQSLGLTALGHRVAGFQLLPDPEADGESWSVEVVRATYWALTRDQVSGHVTGAGFRDLRWLTPAESGFFQPLLLARR